MIYPNKSKKGAQKCRFSQKMPKIEDLRTLDEVECCVFGINKRSSVVFILFQPYLVFLALSGERKKKKKESVFWPVEPIL